MRTLFIEDLEKVTGGAPGGNGKGKGPKKPPPPWCPEVTTLACGEEANGCSGC